MGDIYKAISNVMAEIGAIPKDKQCTQGSGFKYRGIDSVMDALHPILSKNKVFIVPEVLEQAREERQSKNGGVLTYSICKIKYTFYTEDGSNVYISHNKMTRLKDIWHSFRQYNHLKTRR